MYAATATTQVMIMQVTESYLMERLSRGLGVWLAGFHSHAEGELRRAIVLLRHHTQVPNTGKSNRHNLDFLTCYMKLFLFAMNASGARTPLRGHYDDLRYFVRLSERAAISLYCGR